MKSVAKFGVIALTVLSFAACGGNKDKGTNDTTTVKVDSTVKTTVDSTKTDTVKKDTTKADTAKK